jgi:hypothetical protein
MKNYYWSGICNIDRLKAIDEITGIANRYATILNFQRFSDISLSLILDVEEGNLTNLKNGLSDIMSMDCADTDLDGSEPECIVLLHITFTKGTGNLKIEVPDIPG